MNKICSYCLCGCTNTKLLLPELLSSLLPLLHMLLLVLRVLRLTI
jgi:hypothetical protein